MELNITEEEYYDALLISSDSDFQIHIKREPNTCFINKGYKLGNQTLIYNQQLITIKQ